MQLIAVFITNQHYFKYFNMKKNRAVGFISSFERKSTAPTLFTKIEAVYHE